MAFLGLVISAVFAGLALPYISGFCAVFTASCGFAVFWWALFNFSKDKKKQFWVSLGWFFIVQAIQLSWLTSDAYMGPMIWGFYIVVCLFFGLQFACLNFLLKDVELVTVYKKIQIPSFSLSTCFSLASFWVLLEFSRDFLFTTCSWNPLGLLLSMDSSCAFASLFGVLSLSFWIIFVNAFFLHALGSVKKMCIWLLLAALPFSYSCILQRCFLENLPKAVLPTVCVQTALLPEEKDFSFSGRSNFVHPLNQWERIFDELEKVGYAPVIILPETAVSFSAYRPIYDLSIVQSIWSSYFGNSYKKDFPSLEEPLATVFEKDGKKNFLVTNAFICQALANHFNGHVIAGFDVQEGGKQFNSALYFRAGTKQVERSDKKILVPLTETIDLFPIGSILKPIAKSFGLTHFLDKGKNTKVLGSEKRFGVCICVEEVYSYIPRELKKLGADVLVSLTNDVWFPSSQLPNHHFLHGKIRAAENGIGLIRACNTGVTCFVNCLGQCIDHIDISENKISILQGDFVISKYKTLFSFLGQIPFICFCFFVLLNRFLLARGNFFLERTFCFFQKITKPIFWARK